MKLCRDCAFVHRAPFRSVPGLWKCHRPLEPARDTLPVSVAATSRQGTDYCAWERRDRSEEDTELDLLLSKDLCGPHGRYWTPSRWLRVRQWLRAWLPLVMLVATGCATLPRHDPPVIEEHLTAVAHCDGTVREFDDNGVVQTVTVREGATLVGERALPNPVALAPYRTFREVAQPESLFVFRGKGGDEKTPPSLALFEADGGAWQLEAIQRVAAYLREALAERGVAVLA